MSGPWAAFRDALPNDAVACKTIEAGQSGLIVDRKGTLSANVVAFRAKFQAEGFVVDSIEEKNDHFTGLTLSGKGSHYVVNLADESTEQGRGITTATIFRLD